MVSFLNRAGPGSRSQILEDLALSILYYMIALPYCTGVHQCLSSALLRILMASRTVLCQKCIDGVILTGLSEEGEDLSVSK